jgi:hypothetical protein
MNAFGYGVGKPDCEYSVAPLSIDCVELVKALRSVVKVASVWVWSSAVLEGNDKLVLLKGSRGEAKDILRLRTGGVVD